MRCLGVFVVWMSLTTAALGAELVVGSFNLESGGADIKRLAGQIATRPDVDIWGLSEVQEEGWAREIAAQISDAAGTPFEAIIGTTGRSDRLAVVFDAERFTVKHVEEIHDLNIGGNVRAPLVVTFADRDSGATFAFMVNHLYRSSSKRRHQQADGLNAWAADIEVPLIAVGDYNFDWDSRGGELKHDMGYDLLTKDGRFSWVKPEQLVPTQCNPKFESVLDFVFVANEKEVLRPLESEILFTSSNYCDDYEANSDHRPIVASFEIGSGLNLGALLAKQACPGKRLDKIFFVICHESSWKIPVWVGYHLTEDGLEGSEKRTSDFRPDPDLQRGERAERGDYKRSGFDRGHMAPAAAFKRSREAMSTTFLMSNMAPQTPALNRRIWRKLEAQVRELVREEGITWVFTGSLFLDEAGNRDQPRETIGMNQVAVPTHYYKVLLVSGVDGNLTMYAFRMPNQMEPIEGFIEDFMVTVDEIELQTDVDFFADLPDELEESLESDPAVWPLGDVE